MSPSSRVRPKAKQNQTIESLLRRGLELHQAGRADQAANLYSQVLRIDRSNPAANHLFGLVELNQGRPDTAVRHIAVALKAAPDDARYLANMGVALSGAGRPAEAVEVLLRAVAINPESAEGYSNLGMVYRMLGRYDAAAEAYRRAAELKPRESTFHYHLANALRVAGDLAEAESAYRSAIDLRPDYALAYGRLAFMLIDQARAGEALQLLDGALAILPENPQLHLQRSRAIYAQGRLEEAIAGFDRTIRLSPGYGEAHLNRALSMRHENRDGSIDAMEELYRSDVASVDDRIFAGFGLGKALADIGAHRQSIEVFIEANRMQRQKVPFSLAREIGHMRADVERFQDLGGKVLEHGLQEALPIFVVGMPRSGKSTVEKILSSHPSLSGAGELPTMGRLVRQLIRESGATELSDLPPSRWAALGRAYMNEAERLVPAGTRVIDTMPSNYHHIGFIRMALPNARIIHCVRPQAEHCVAVFEKLLTGPGFEYSNDLDDLRGYYAAHRQMMSYWHARFPGFIYDLDLAAIATDRRGQLGKLLEFCGVEWNDACLAEAQSEPQYRDWPLDRVARNRAEHMAAWREVRPQLWD